MQKLLLYRVLAKYYDLIYSFKNYKKESDELEKLIAKNKKSSGKALLEVACGTAHHLEYLKNNFSCMGIDLNQSILNVAKAKIKNVVFKKADMINFDLKKQFDVITCLFSSIGYVKTYENLEKTIKNFAKHLKTGGVVIIEPWLTKEYYALDKPHMTIYEDKDLKIARLNTSKVKDGVSVMDMHYLIAERGKDVKHFVDRHELGLFEVDKTLAIMKKAGLKAKFIKSGLMKNRGLYVGVKE
ncbi:MAG: class I SAM-dependent methyltransferase [Patescibacteria group bacterium]|nr:class I SAM-dependent methyltransferase [Patescibacteria group bacterium]